MRIIYSPYFDQGTYRSISPGSVLMDEQVVGTRGLLDELELRAGMTGKETPWFTRVVEYYKAIKSVLAAGHKTFFEESFFKDELGVSGELLRWRDALVMAGWTPDLPADSAGMRLCASPEPPFLQHRAPFSFCRALWRISSRHAQYTHQSPGTASLSMP